MSKGRSRAWCFTINNPTTKPSFGGQERYLVYQLEKGLETGTEHYQGFVYFGTEKSPKQLKEWLPTAHLEIAKSISGSIEYCMKEDTRLDGPWESGVRPSQGKRSDLDIVAGRVLEGVSTAVLARSHATAFVRYHRGLQALRAATVTPRSEYTMGCAIIGATGVGKTTAVLERYPLAYWKPPLNKWWDNYDQQEVVVIDEFTGWLPIEMLLRLVDRSPLLVETKGGQVNFCAKKIIFLSNIPPEQWYPEHPLLPSLMRRLIVEVKHNHGQRLRFFFDDAEREIEPTQPLTPVMLDYLLDAMNADDLEANHSDQLE